jgi:hypothetical protein|tara:strand:+ start:29 stop:592 length:564 start_codon:yes stop_codon:yes gene_type:complete
MVKIVDNCCSLDYLDTLKSVASNSESWNLKYPIGAEDENRFLKLEIINDGIKHPLLAGLAMGLLIQIHEVSGQDLFIPEIWQCGISIKDKHTSNNIHKDHLKGEGFVKILGIITRDWEENYGGGFFYNGTSNYIKPTSFCIFDPTEEHANEEIFTDKKRFAIDFAVFKNEQSLERWQKGPDYEKETI